MIVTGWTYPGDTTTEIIDVIHGETCAELANFPIEIAYSVGANLQGTPIVCGGNENFGDHPLGFHKFFLNLIIIYL